MPEGVWLVTVALITSGPAWAAWWQSRSTHRCLDKHIRDTAEHHAFTPNRDPEA